MQPQLSNGSKVRTLPRKRLAWPLLVVLVERPYKPPLKPYRVTQSQLPPGQEPYLPRPGRQTRQVRDRALRRALHRR